MVAVPSYRTMIQIGLLAFLVVGIYYQNLQWLWASWMENPNYSHGPLIPLIALYLIYQKREKLKAAFAANHDAHAGILIIILAGMIQVLCLRAQITFLSSYSMIVMIMGMVWYFLGKKTFVELRFPLAYLIFMVPFWVGILNMISSVLKMASSVISYHLLRLLGFAALRDGVMLAMRNGNLEVADPCSGIRSLVSLLAAGVLIAYLDKGYPLRKVIIVFLVVPLAVFWNSIRIVVFGVLLEFTGSFPAEGFFHTATGVLVFILSWLPLILIARWN
jgi:exosortase